MKRTFILLCLVSFFTAILSAADFDARTAFGTTPGRDLDSALKRAQKDKKRVFVAVYDSKGDYNDQGLQIKYFTDLDETKKLLKDNFVIVLLDKNHKDLAKYPTGGNTERPYYIIISPDGKQLKTDNLVANPSDGLRRTKEILAAP